MYEIDEFSGTPEERWKYMCQYVSDQLADYERR